jgi:hypothetical protein
MSARKITPSRSPARLAAWKKNSAIGLTCCIQVNLEAISPYIKPELYAAMMELALEAEQQVREAPAI